VTVKLKGGDVVVNYTDESLADRGRRAGIRGRDRVLSEAC